MLPTLGLATPALRRGVVSSFNATTWVATVVLDGAIGVVDLPAGQWVRGLAANDAVVCLFFDDSNPDDGVILGAFGAPPTAGGAYTPTNVTPDRAYDADATTVAELADALGTLIADLQAYGRID